MIGADDLIRTVRKGRRKAAGPDAWQVGKLLQLPRAWWERLADLWSAVIAGVGLPARWAEARVSLIPKADSDGLRPLNIVSGVWRAGAPAIAKKVANWCGQLAPGAVSGLAGRTPAVAHVRL